MPQNVISRPPYKSFPGGPYEPPCELGGAGIVVDCPYLIGYNSDSCLCTFYLKVLVLLGKIVFIIEMQDEYLRLFYLYIS